MKKLSFLFAALVAMSLVAEAAGIDSYKLIDPSKLKATAISSWSSRGPELAVNGAGLVNGKHKSDKANGQMWMSESSSAVSTSKPLWFKVDLGSVHKVGAIKFWNFNWMNGTQDLSSRGIKATEIYCSSAESPAGGTVDEIRKWMVVKDDYVVPQGIPSDDYAGADPLILDKPVGARWIAFVFTSDWGGACGGISEVQFFEAALPDCDEKTVTRESDGSFTVGAKVVIAAADKVSVLAYADDASDPVEFVIGENVAVGESVEGSVTGLSENKTYKLVFACSMDGEINYSPCGIVYTGAPVLEKKVDAYEDGLLPGEITVSRAEASPYPLTFNYAFSSEDAEEGVDYETPEGVIEIPVDETSATILLQPKENKAKASDLTVTVSGEAGLYASPEPVDVLIRNGGLPTDANVWIADGTHGNLASTAENWSKGVPTAGNAESLVILVNTLYGEADMVWDAGVNGLADTVTSWRQTANSTNTVTFLTTYPAYAGSSFKTFTVTDEVSLEGGTWTHPVSANFDDQSAIPTVEGLRAACVYRLSVKANDLTIGESGKIDVVGKGHSQKRINANTAAFHSAHGGSTAGISAVGAYGNVKYPEDVGFAGNGSKDSISNQAAGGGAVKLQIEGLCTIDGEINADGEVPSNDRAAGAGGSILIEANRVAGTGVVHADGVYCGVDTGDKNNKRYNGAGGRVAIITQVATDVSVLTVSACQSGSGNTPLGGGTVYLKDADHPNGVLYLVNRLTSVNGNSRTYGKACDNATPVTAEGDWTFDGVVLGGGFSDLVVGEGATLKLPNGFESVDASRYNARSAAIIANGGTIDVGSGDQMLSGNWFFMPLAPYSFSANVMLQNGSAIGVPSEYQQDKVGTEAAFLALKSINCTVAGNLTVGEGCVISSEGMGTGYNTNPSWKGIDLGGHGGTLLVRPKNADWKPLTKSHDSVFSPYLPGLQDQGYAYVHPGGVVTLNVGGKLTVNGVITSNGSSSGGVIYYATPGSVNITAGSLAGSGRISASCGSFQAGGRVAVKLTDADADFESFTGTLAANCNENVTDKIANNCYMTSPGSVYLETAADGAKGGEIIINNVTEGLSTNSTPICATGYGADEVGDFRKASLLVKGTARASVEVVDADGRFQMKKLTMSDTAKLDLCGHTFAVTAAVLGDTKLKPGTYVASAYPDFLTGGGLLIVKGTGLMLLVR